MSSKELREFRPLNRFLNLECANDDEIQKIIELSAEACDASMACLVCLSEDKSSVSFIKSYPEGLVSRPDLLLKYLLKDERGTQAPPPEDQVFLNGELPATAFYLSLPLFSKRQECIGYICVMDDQPKELNTVQSKILPVLSAQLTQLLAFDYSIKKLKAEYTKSMQTSLELRSFFESSLDHHLLLDNKFKILAFNEAWKNHVRSNYGLTMKRGRRMTPYIHPKNFDGFFHDYLSALNGKPVFDERCLVVKGENTWRRVRFEPAVDNHGNIFGVSIICADITQQIRQKEIVQRQESVLKEIAYLQCHELRKPVATILGLINLLDLDNPCQLQDKIDELTLLRISAKELDEKIKLVVEHATEMVYMCSRPEPIDHDIQP